MVSVADLIDATELFAPLGLVRCALPATGYWAGECPCGHVRDGWMCKVHAEMAGEGGCRACVELEDRPHDCPLPLARVTSGARRREHLPQNSPGRRHPPRPRFRAGGKNAAAVPPPQAAAAPGAAVPPHPRGGTWGTQGRTSGMDHPSVPLVPDPVPGTTVPGAEGGMVEPRVEAPTRARAAAAPKPSGSRGSSRRGARRARGAAPGGDPAPGAALASPPVSEGNSGGDPGPAGDARPHAASPAAAGRTRTIELPAGLPILSMNGRDHWRARNRKAQALKDAAIVMTRKARVPRLKCITVALYYDPPDRRRRDHDNLTATYKPLVDGIVKAGVVPDDSPEFVYPPHCEVTDSVHPRGRLRMVIVDLGGEVQRRAPLPCRRWEAAAERGRLSASRCPDSSCRALPPNHLHGCALAPVPDPSRPACGTCGYPEGTAVCKRKHQREAA